MVKKVEKTHRKGTHEMGTGEYETSGGSVTESHLFKCTPAVFRGGCIGLPNGYALGDSQRQGLLLSWRGSWVLSEPQGPWRLQADVSKERLCHVCIFLHSQHTASLSLRQQENSTSGHI